MTRRRRAQRDPGPQLTARDQARALPHSRLMAGIKHSTDLGLDVPCINSSHPDHWTSSRPTERAQAATQCGACPVAQQCLAYALEHETSGVWGGRNLDTPTTGPLFTPDQEGGG